MAKGVSTGPISLPSLLNKAGGSVIYPPPGRPKGANVKYLICQKHEDRPGGRQDIWEPCFNRDLVTVRKGAWTALTNTFGTNHRGGKRQYAGIFTDGTDRKTPGNWQW